MKARQSTDQNQTGQTTAPASGETSHVERLAGQNSNICVEMGQFASHHFEEGDTRFISTHSVTDCVVLLIKNLEIGADGKKTCTHVSLGHFNQVHLFDSQMAKQNVNAMLDNFAAVGGQLEGASIQILGGLDMDHAQRREKLKNALEANGVSKDIIKEPNGYTNSSQLIAQGGMSQLVIAVNQEGTYTRQYAAWVENSQVKSNTRFNTKKAENILVDGNVRTVVNVDDVKKEEQVQKTTYVLTAINSGADYSHVLAQYGKMEPAVRTVGLDQDHC